jgi:hypothetical protein
VPLTSICVLTLASGHWLQPHRRTLVPVPLQFGSPQQFAEVIGNNLLAEFYHVVAEGRSKGKRLRVTPQSGKQLLV